MTCSEAWLENDSEVGCVCSGTSLGAGGSAGPRVMPIGASRKEAQVPDRLMEEVPAVLSYLTAGAPPWQPLPVAHPELHLPPSWEARGCHSNSCQQIVLPKQVRDGCMSSGKFPK